MTSWSGVAEAYRRSFATLCAGTIDILLEGTAPAADGNQPPRSGRRRHLDVGCGTGQLALAAARRGREVVAADADPDMAALTRVTTSRNSGNDGNDGASATQEGTVSVLEAGSPTLPFPDASFDAITANFVINHVPDPRATLRDLARLAAPSAPIALTIWPAAPGPHLASYGEAARLAGATPVPSTRLPPELDFHRSIDGLAGLVGGAGLRVLEARDLAWTWTTSAEDLMAGIAGGIATPGRIHRAQTPQVRACIEEHVRDLWSHWAAEGVDAAGGADVAEGAETMLAFPATAPYVLAVRE